MKRDIRIHLLKYTNLLRVFLLTFLVVGFFIVYFPIWKNLVLNWSYSDEYSYGFLIVPLALFIAWRKKEKLTQMHLEPSAWGLPIFIISLICYLFSFLAGISTLSSFSIVLTIVGILLYLVGFSILKELMFPVLFLLFIIPIPAQIYSYLTIPLQLFVSQVVTAISSLLGVPIYREGNVLHLPNQILQVVQACSGLRSMVSLLTLSLVYGYFALKSNFLKILLFFSAIPIAIFVNIVRVLLLVLVLYFLQIDLTFGAIHNIFGVFIFVLSLLTLFAVKGILCLWDRPVIHE